MGPKNKTYTPMPEVPSELRDRYQLILQVMSGELTVTQAARQLGMSRNHFQSIMHKALQGMLEGLTLKQPGRPGKPAQQAQQERELQRLRKENDKLRFRVDNFDRLLGIAADVLNRRMRATPTTRQNQSPAQPTERKESDDDEPEALLAADAQMRALGLGARLRAALLGVGASTVRRWLGRAQQGLELQASRGPRPHDPPGPEAVEKVSAIVRQLHGLVGADSLSHSVDGVSRRQAAAIKKATLIEMERERRGDAQRVEIHIAGVVRGMDAMYVNTVGGWRWVLVFADAAVPFRTTIAVLDRYDDHCVALAMEQDFLQNGAPLVLRCDRWSAHRSPEVLAVAQRFGVLLLSGPAHHPCFYGQTERQNREHRGWLDAMERVPAAQLQTQSDVMIGSLNRLWKRRTLGWLTAQQVWNERPTLIEDRNEFAQEVHKLAASIERQGATPIDAQRFAIEHALRQRGYLRQEAGGWC